MAEDMKGHAHHISVHFVVANYSVGLIFAILYLLTGNVGFDIASYYTLGAALAATPFGFISGVHIWRKKYKGRWAKLFKTKFFGGLLLAILGLAIFNIRYIATDVLTAAGAMTAFYVILLALASGCVSVLGYYGGKLTIK
jgi:uncharacterized membrane protein